MMDNDHLNGHRIAFEKMEWVESGVGIRTKIFHQHNQRIRLVEFSEGFAEPDWCMKGHACYVLEGSFSIDFNGSVEHYNEGDICYIPAGENDKHKAILSKGERVLLLLFETDDKCENGS
jgi:quercetin dioxygenase-like cupin family protein